MRKELCVLRCEAAAAILPVRLRKQILALPDEKKAVIEEFRLRVGRPLSVLLPGGEMELDAMVESAELETLCDLATEFSRYAAVETMKDGFLSVRGGFRVGLCGTAVMKDGQNCNLKHLSGASVRIARELCGIADGIVPQLLRDGRVCSTLILSPPGCGKTTLLRDLVRQLSDGFPGSGCFRVGLIDERGEVAVMYRGEPQMQVGTHTDVLDACPKALGIPMLLRGMNPEVIAVDEITVQEDLRAISLASGCGVSLLATIHGSGLEDLQRKPLYRELLQQRVFEKVVLIQNVAGKRRYQVEDLQP